MPEDKSCPALPMVNDSMINCLVIDGFVQNWDIGKQNPKAFFNHIEQIVKKNAPNRGYFSMLVRSVAEHQLYFCLAFLSFTNAAVSELEVGLRAEYLLVSPPFPPFYWYLR